MKIKTLLMVILCLSSIYGYNQCLDLSDSTIAVQFGDTVELDFGSLFDSEVVANSELELWLSTDEGDWNLSSFHQLFNTKSEPKIQIDPYAKGAYESTIRREYFVDGIRKRLCFDTITVLIVHDNDERFDSISNGHLRVGTGTGSMLFADSRRGLFRMNGFNVEMFSYAYGGTSLLIGGRDSTGDIYVSGHDYMRAGYSEAVFGPEGVSESNNDSFNKVWKVRSYRLNEDDKLPVNYIDSNQKTQQLLDFVDVDSNGFWNSDIDYQCVFGDEMLYSSYHYNEIQNEQWFHGKQLPVRVNQFLFLSNEEGLENVLFGRFEVTNYSSITFNNVNIGMYNDLDAGWYNIQKGGCDTVLDLFYSYIPEPQTPNLKHNGKEPSLGVMFLNKGLDSYIPFYKSFTNICTPLFSYRDMIYHYLEGKNKYGDDMYDHKYLCDSTKGSKVTRRLFPGNPFLDTIDGGMHMNTDKVQSNYYYHVGGSGPFELGPNETITFDVAWVIGFDGKRTGMENLKAMKEQAKRARNHYQENGFACRLKEELSIEKADGPNFNIYPNPSNGILNVEAEEKGRLEIYSSTGKLMSVHEINVGTNQLSFDLQKGIYLVVLTSEKGIRTQRLTIN